MKRLRGRSMTVRKNATNARRNRTREDEVDPLSSPRDARWRWWRRLAVFGESKWAITASLALLGCSMGVSVIVSDFDVGGVGGNLNDLEFIWRQWISPQLSWWLGQPSQQQFGYSYNNCSIERNARPALQPYDLDKLFLETAANYTTSRNGSVTVHSSPRLEKRAMPWIITFDHFLTEEECDALIELGYKYGFTRSLDVHRAHGEPFDSSFGKLTTRRTSETAWCTGKSGCRAEVVPHRLHERISDFLGIPMGNSEDIQILKYKVGQFYKVHHDYIPHQQNRQCGPRILTLFMYLSDVAAGGETHFPYVNTTIIPKKGMALLFPNVIDSEPFTSDARMIHEAFPVKSGVKFAANVWIHLYNYQHAVKRGCN